MYNANTISYRNEIFNQWENKFLNILLYNKICKKAIKYLKSKYKEPNNFISDIILE